MKESFATVLEAVADVMGDRPALLHGGARRARVDLDGRLGPRIAGW